MWICFGELKTNGPRTAPFVLQSSMGCSYMPPLKGRRRQNESSAEVTCAAYAPAEPRGRHVPAIQLVWPETSREKLLDIYLEVYKLHRLPSSLPGELAILEEVCATVPGQLWEKEETPNVQRQPSHKDFHLSQMRKPHQKKGNFSG